MNVPPEQPSKPPNGSNSSEASTMEDSENGQPLTAATTPENVIESTEHQDESNKEAAETKPVKSEFEKDSIHPAPPSLASSKTPEDLGQDATSLPSLPVKVNWDDNIDVDALSDEDKDIGRRSSMCNLTCSRH